MYNIKNKGPKMDHCGTPHLMVCIDDSKKTSFLFIAEPHHGYRSAPVYQIRFDGQERRML